MLGSMSTDTDVVQDYLEDLLKAWQIIAFCGFAEAASWCSPSCGWCSCSTPVPGVGHGGESQSHSHQQ